MKTLYTKILAVQKAMKPIEKDATNPHFKNRYFDINSLLAALKPELNEAGLVVLQNLSNVNGAPALDTVVAEAETGESMSSTVLLPTNPDPQKMGAVISYFRRYALTSMFLLEGEDDDGNSARKVEARSAAPAKPSVSQEDKDRSAIVSNLLKLGHVCKTKEEYSAKCKELTGLNLVPACYGEILGRLNVIIQEKQPA